MGLNLFNLQEEYLYLMADIEEAGGEITPELEERLAINKEDAKEKFDAYAHIIALKEGQNRIIDDEIARLNNLKITNVKTIDRLKDTLLTALELFGDYGKTGNRKLETVTHKFWNVYHKPLAIDEDASLPDTVGDHIIRTFTLDVRLTTEQKDKITELLTEDDFVPNFSGIISRTEIKKALEEGLEIDGAKIDEKASYLRIK